MAAERHRSGRGLSQIPEPRGGIVAASRQRAPIRAECQRCNAALVTFEYRWLCVGLGEIPEPHSRIGAAGRQRTPIGAERQGCNAALVTFEDGWLGGGLGEIT